MNLTFLCRLLLLNRRERLDCFEVWLEILIDRRRC
jgi:hypothetical protein